MKGAIEYIRALIVSPEICLALLIALLCLLLPKPFEILGTRFKSDQEFWKLITAVPAGAFIWGVTQAKEILFPSKESNQRLLEWPEYWRLKIRVYAGLSILLLAVIVTFIVLLYKDEWSNIVVGGVLAAITIASLVSSATFWLAGVRVREITEQVAR